MESQVSIDNNMTNKQHFDVDFRDINSIIKYIINNYEKFLLLLLSIIIVYIVDHINNINTMIYGAARTKLYPKRKTK